MNLGTLLSRHAQCQPDKVSEDELKTWVNERVGAKFQRIQHVVIMEELPRNIAGKVLKRVMRDEFAARLSL